MVNVMSGETTAGCGVGMPIMSSGLPAEALTRRQTSCADAGFTADTPDFRLCLLLQQTNERLTAVERRLSALEQDWTLTRPYFGPWPW